MQVSCAYERGPSVQAVEEFACDPCTGHCCRGLEAELALGSACSWPSPLLGLWARGLAKALHLLVPWWAREREKPNCSWNQCIPGYAGRKEANGGKEGRPQKMSHHPHLPTENLSAIPVWYTGCESPVAAQCLCLWRVSAQWEKADDTAIM